jgi:hypothetical protein
MKNIVQKDTGCMFPGKVLWILLVTVRDSESKASSVLSEEDLPPICSAPIESSMLTHSVMYSALCEKIIRH